jgi:hypothetical protein
MADRSSDVHRAAATHHRTDHLRTLDLAESEDTQDQDRSPIRLEVTVSLSQSRYVRPDLAQKANVDILALLYLPSCDCSSSEILSPPRTHYSLTCVS